MKIGISPKIGTPFVSIRGGVGGGVFITDVAVEAAAVIVAAAVVVDDDVVGCDCFDCAFFIAGPALAALDDFDLVDLLSAGVGLVGSFMAAATTAVAVGVGVDLVRSIFRFFFFGLSSMADSDVFISFADFDCAFFFPFGLAATSWSAFFYKSY